MQPLRTVSVPNFSGHLGLGGAMAAISGILLLSVIGLSPTQLTLLVFPGLAAALFGRLRSIPRTVIAGLMIGIFESWLVGFSWPVELVDVSRS